MKKLVSILFCALLITVQLYSNKYVFPIGKDNVNITLLSNKWNINIDALQIAIKGYEKLKEQGKLLNNQYLTLVDFSLPSNSNRFYIIDMLTQQVIINTLVAHGKNSGTLIANSFSNKNASLKSSLGFYITGNTYKGKHGNSLLLEGVEKGINDHAQNRAIVIHGANYVSDHIVNKGGIIGRSFGCPAVPTNKVKEIIATIKQGTCMFIYAPNEAYLNSSQLAK
jgi:hypothetical protein